MWTSILAMLGGMIPKLFNWYINYKTRKAELEQVNRSAEIAAGLELGQAQLEATGSRFKELIAFIAIGPFVIAMAEGIINAFLLMFGFSPIPISIVKEIFIEMSHIPEWSVGLSITIITAIWGIQAGAGAVAKVFSGVSDAWRIKRETANIVRDMDIDRKAIFDGLRAMNRGQGLSQEAVDYFNQVLDAATKTKGSKK